MTIDTTTRDRQTDTGLGVGGAEAAVLAVGPQRRMLYPGGWAFVAAHLGSGSAVVLRIRDIGESAR